MKWLTVLLAVLFLAACDFTVPLADKPAQAIDERLLGLWERTNHENKPERLLVLPLSREEYLVVFPAFEKTSLFAKACLVECAGKTMVQLQWIGTAEGRRAEGNRIYQYVSCSVDGSKLETRLLNAALVGREARTSAELRQGIETNRSASQLFADPMIFFRAGK